MPTFKVSTKFGAKDQLSPVFKKMGKNADKFGDRSSKAFRKASKSASMFKSVTGGILAAGAISKGIGLIGRGATAAATGFIDFDQAITSASAKFAGLDLTTKEGQQTLLDLKRTAREVGATTEFSADQAAGGLDFLALAGFNAQQAMALLPGVTNLATVANLDLATATDIASDSLGAFGLMTKDSTQLAKNFTRVQDVMAKTTATSNTNLTDMFEAVKKGAPDFTAAGQSIETFSTLIGTMANSGIKGAEAGTKLRNIAVRLTGGSKEAADAIKGLGIKVADGSGNFRDMLDIIDDVITGTSKMGEVQRSAALKTIFGARQTGGLNVIMKEGTENLRSYRQVLIDSNGAAEKMAKIMRSSLMNRIKSLGSALLEVGFQFFDAFDTQGAKAIDRLTMLVRKVNLVPMTDGIKNLVGRITELGVRTGVFKELKNLAIEMIPLYREFGNAVIGVVKGLDDLGVFTALAAILRVVLFLMKQIVIQTKAFAILFRPLQSAFGLGKAALPAIGRSLASTVLTERTRGELGLAPPNVSQAAAIAAVNVGVETTVNAPQGTTAETTVKKARRVDKSALGPNSVSFAGL